MNAAATLSESYSDPEFPICSIPPWKANLYRFLSVGIWGGLPEGVQRKISAWYASHYDKPYTRGIIRHYVRLYYKDRNYLNKFKPPGGKSTFRSFQDFFIREFRELPKNESLVVWPCEGLLCDVGKVGSFDTVKVKNDRRTLSTIFGLNASQLPDHYNFSNVFLHNKNYHRIHAPVSGIIKRIQHIPGELIVLRPWIYRNNPSLPAFRNERYNVDIADSEGRIWYMSIVGGPAVGTIRLPEGIQVGNPVNKLQELAVFYLGSTCCMAAPDPPRYHSAHTFVEVGASY